MTAVRHLHLHESIERRDRGRLAARADGCRRRVASRRRVGKNYTHKHHKKRIFAVERRET